MGTTADDLKSKLDGGANLRDLLKESRVSHEDVKAAFEEAFKSWRNYGAVRRHRFGQPADGQRCRRPGLMSDDRT